MEEKKMAGYPKKDSKNGTYYFVLEAGKDTSGKRKRVKRSGFKKINEAKAAMAELMLELKKGNSPIEKEMSVHDYLNFWLDNYAKTNTKPKTFAEYEKIIKTHIQPSLGKINLYALTSIRVQQYYAEKLEVLSSQSVLHHHRVLTKALNDAVDWEFLSRNVAKKAKPPKPLKREMKTLCADQLNILVETAKEVTPIYFPIIYTAGHTGMRKSELMGLSWENVDLKNSRLYVRQTITEANGKYFINKRPKNGIARGIKLTVENTKLLMNLKVQNDELRNALGETYNPLNLVFCNSAGNIMAPSEITRALKRALKVANLPDIRFHDVRHSHATILLQAGIHPKIVSERLGHSKVGITLDLYSHVTATIQDQAVTALNEVLN
ncbi:hypothetical protein CVD27_22795 [Neobacillus cucumis]|uniref:Site-specific integrase n=2 Tax=Neobacillus cucumis TaxID=1740721 RepID=A0A2N5H8U1_9BACI|nr:hypothetical protein CVD27_22795 [Neobacillus cucumis]